MESQDDHSYDDDPKEQGTSGNIPPNGNKNKTNNQTKTKDIPGDDSKQNTDTDVICTTPGTDEDDTSKKETLQDNESMTKSTEVLENENETLKKEFEEIDNDRKSLERTVQLLKSDIEQLKMDQVKKLKALEEALEASIMKHLDLAEKNSKLKSENASMEKEIKSKDKTMEDTRRKVEKLNIELQKENNKRKEDVKSHTAEKNKFKAEKQEFDKKIKEWNKERNKLQCVIQGGLTKIKTQESDIAKSRLEAENMKYDHSSLSQHARNLRKETEYLQAQIRTYQQENRSLGEEKEVLLLRLSKIAGANLTYNNPNIADLSDEKRPSKLSEEFSELYDNEWTDAFEKIEGDSDETKTRALYGLLKHANEYCQKLSKGHYEAIKKGFTTLEYVRTLPVTKESDKRGKLRTKDEPSSNLKDSSTIEQEVGSSSMMMTDDNADNKITDISVNEDQISTSVNTHIVS